MTDLIANLNEIFEKQQRTFKKNRSPSAAQRIDRLERLQRALIINEQSLISAINQDYHNRSLFESRLAEIFPCMEGIKYAKRHVRKWMKPQRRPVGKWFLPASAKVISQPVGVVGIMVPWNYPLYLAIGPLTYPLAGANSAMIKLSEFTLLQN